MRVRAFIDGFNFYHSLVDIHRKASRWNSTVNLNHLKWVNYRTLLSRFTFPPEYLERVLYFSAYADHISGARQRHELYVRALTLHGVEPILGRFKEKSLRCKECHVRYKGHEEKETDVNIAVHLLAGAMNREFDVALVISQDSDLVPAIKMARLQAPDVQVRIVTPPQRVPSVALKSAAGSSLDHAVYQSLCAKIG